MPDITYTPYYPLGWQDEPVETTAIVAAALDNIENGVVAATAQANAALDQAIAPGIATMTDSYLALTGATNSIVSAPDASALRLSGDIDLRIGITLANLNNGQNQAIVAKQGLVGATATTSWIARENANGKLALATSLDGTTLVTATASVNTPTGVTDFRFTRRQSDGVCRFWVPWTGARTLFDGASSGSPNQKTFTSATANFTSADVGMLIYSPGVIPDGTTIQSVGPANTAHISNNAIGGPATGITFTIGARLADGTKWQNLGTDQVAAIGALFTGTTLPLAIGGVASNSTQLVAGVSPVRYMTLRSGIDLPDGTSVGTVVANPVFTGRALNSTTVTDTASTPNKFTLYGTTSIVPTSGVFSKNGVTLGLATSATIQASTKRYYADKWGDLATSDETRRAAVQSATDAAFNNGGGIVDVTTGSSSPIVVGPNTSLTNQITNKPYAAILARDRVTYEGDGPYAGGLMLANGANCHLIGGPGRLNGSGFQDHIDNVRFVGLKLDGNKTNQDGCHDHDGLRLAQFPGVVIEDVMIQNVDGHGYYSSANGDFAANVSDIGTNANATVVKPLTMRTVWSHDNARWGFMMSATNRKTVETNLYAVGNGTAQARIAGKVSNPTISSPGGTLALQFDASATTYSISLSTGATGATITSAINTSIGSAGTAAYSSGGRLMITSATIGGASWVNITGASTAQVLTDLGMALGANKFNGENNGPVGGNEYGGMYADHSEAKGDGWYAEGNIGDGVYIHNVNLCNFAHIESTNNNGVGIVATQFVTSSGGYWASGMNCVDFGRASYRPPTILNASSSPVTTPSTEVLIFSNTGGYGNSTFSTVNTIVAPGLKSSLGAGTDNRHANYAVVIEHGVDSSLTFGTLLYADGGLVGNMLDYR